MKTTTPCMILSTDMPAKHTIIQSQNMEVSMEEVKIGRNIQDTMEYQGIDEKDDRQRQISAPYFKPLIKNYQNIFFIFDLGVGNHHIMEVDILSINN